MVMSAAYAARRSATSDVPARDNGRTPTDSPKRSSTAPIRATTTSARCDGPVTTCTPAPPTAHVDAGNIAATAASSSRGTGATVPRYSARPARTTAGPGRLPTVRRYASHTAPNASGSRSSKPPPTASRRIAAAKSGRSTPRPAARLSACRSTSGSSARSDFADEPTIVASIGIVPTGDADATDRKSAMRAGWPATATRRHCEEGGDGLLGTS
jgi:hypothetical protein